MAHLVYEDKKVPLEKECVLGRQKDCGVIVKDGKSSRHHARVFLLESEWWLEDLESANGTMLNGKAIAHRSRIHNGDVIGIGASRITLVNEHTQEIRLERIPEDMVGRTIAGYVIDGKIGTGVTGTIYTATQTALERGVAFKVMDPRLTSSDPGFADRFLKTINVAASIHDDGIVKIHECGKDQGLLWYTMELVEGDTLEQLLKRDGPMEPPLALMIIEKAAAALQSAHEKGLVHGDVKPATIMLTETGHVKILDIGVVGLSGNESRMVQGIAATKQVFYLAPEQARGGASDVRSDVYSLGCVLFHALTGKVPFGGTDFKAVVAAHESQPVPEVAKRLKLPLAVDKVLQQMLNKNVSWRYESMTEVRTALRELRELVTPDAADEAHETQAREKIAVRARARNTQRQSAKFQKLAMMLLVVLAVAMVIGFVGLPDLGRFMAHPDRPDVVDQAGTGTTQGVAGGGTTGSTGSTTVVAAGTAGATTGAITGGTTTGRDPWSARWQEAKARIDASAARNDWGAAEQTLKHFTDDLHAKAPTSDVAQSARLRGSQLVSDGEAWYQAQLDALPAASDAAAAPRRLRQLASLRDVALSGKRGDAEARYQEALSKLTQRLAEARSRARQALEAGRLDDLPPLAKSLEPAFAGTPVAGLHRNFATMVTEAAKTKPMWKGSWQATESALVSSSGAACVPAAAALMLAGGANDLAAAKRLLGDPALASGDALKRKEALLGNEAAMLSFDDIGDLQYIDVLQGEPRLEKGALVGDDTCGIACTVPVGGASWSAALSLQLRPLNAKESGEAVISCVSGENVPLMVRIDPELIHVRATTADGVQEAQGERSAGADKLRVRLRLSCRDSNLQILVDDQPLAGWEQARVPAGSQLRFEVGGFAWRLDDLQVIAGE